MIQQISRFIVAPIIICVTLTQCSWLIPQEKSEPRYNEVIGEPRRPQLNNTNAAPSSDAQIQRLAMAAPVAPVVNIVPPPAANVPMPTPVTAPVFPPVSPETQARADAVIARDVPPPAIVPVNPELARRVPVENAGVGDNTIVAQTNYPSLNSIPPSTMANDLESASRLARIRAQLEQERAEANGQRTQLNNDAAAQPSLLRDGNVAPIVAPPEPVAVKPIAPPVIQMPAATLPSLSPQSSSALPPPPAPLMASNTSEISRYIPFASPTVSAPTPNVGVVANQSFAIPLVPQQAPLQEPIILRPPQAMAMASPAAMPVPTRAQNPQVNMAPAASGGFNPLEGANAGYTANDSTNSYLPPSRYSSRRNY